MLDDLRNTGSTYEEEPQPTEEQEVVVDRRAQREPFLGMTPPQRFVIAVMLFLMVCVLGCLTLIAFNKIYLPFL